MANIVSVERYGSSNFKLNVEQPDECPLCHVHCEPKVLTAIDKAAGGERVQACVQCPRDECRGLFIAYYAGTRRYEKIGEVWSLARCEPVRFAAAEFHEKVTQTSPSFATIYNQALHAESQGLDQLTGIGLRKALEFLVKDFCKTRHPNDTDKIEKQLLGKVIDTFVTDPHLKACAKRAAWLGNDETHYIRKWEGKDIEDLKRLVVLTANWVTSTILTEEYVNEMPDPS
jgi:hypothetical protein